MLSLHKTEICKRCPFWPRMFVGSVGPVDAKIVLVGDSPWRQEVESGRPFSGLSGEILNFCLEAANIKRDDVYVTNVVKCQPYALGENYPDGVVDLCTKYFLLREIEVVRPDVVVALGNSAFRVFSKDRGNISKVRGIEQHVKWFDLSLNILPTFHPSFLLRQPSYADYVVQDLKTASSRPQHTIHEYEKKANYVHVNSVERFMLFLAQAKKSETLAWDIETTSLDHRTNQLVSINISLEPYSAHTLTFFTPDGNQHDEMLSTHVIRKIYALLHDSTKRMYFHNGKFDLLGLHYWFLRTIGQPINIHAIRWYDTMGMAVLLNENMRRDLKSICSIETSIRYDRDELEFIHGGNILKMPQWKLVHYGGKDADGTHRIAKIFEQKLRDEKLWYGPFVGKEYSDMAVANVLFEMELFGAPISKEKLFHLQHVIESKLKFFESEIQKIVSHAQQRGRVRISGLDEIQEPSNGFNVRSVKQLRHVLYDVLKFPCLKLTKAGEKSTDKFTIDELFKLFPNHPFLKMLKLHRNYDTLYKTFVKGLQARIWDDGRLRPDFSFTSIVSGRIACYNPNLLNIPRDREFEDGVLLSVRDVFGSSDTIIIFGDFNQIEFKCAALLSKDAAMIEDLFVHRFDYHDMVARAVYPKYIEYENEITELENKLLETDPDDKEFVFLLNKKIDSIKVLLKSWRTTAKNFNFGLLYGGQDDTLAAALGVDVSKVRVFTRRFERKYPKFWQFIKSFPEKAVKEIVVTNSFRRKRHLFPTPDPYVALENGRKGINFMPQSDAAYVGRAALVRIAHRCRRSGLRGFPFNIVYDSILLECPEEEKSACITIMAEEMLRPVPELGGVTFSIGLGWGRSWREAENHEHKLYDVSDIAKLLHERV